MMFQEYWEHSTCQKKQQYSDSDKEEEDEDEDNLFDGEHAMFEPSVEEEH